LIVYRAGAAGAPEPPNAAQMLDFVAFCLECGAPCGAPTPCAACGGRRIVRHPELAALEIAHLDCDAFYAAVEKRDDPSLADRPVIVGGGARGVVTTCCYVARTYGVRSAMPMFKALKACPDAVVIKPDFRKYAEAARKVRSRMEALTPLVEPLSIDEAFLDLAGTRRLLRMAPAQALAALQRDIRREIGITVSIGLAPNKFLAKLASDLDKPNGFSVIGRMDAKARLAPMPVSAIWGVGLPSPQPSPATDCAPLAICKGAILRRWRGGTENWACACPGSHMARTLDPFGRSAKRRAFQLKRHSTTTSATGKTWKKHCCRSPNALLRACERRNYAVAP
jgi:hypothetical protein